MHVPLDGCSVAAACLHMMLLALCHGGAPAPPAAPAAPGSPTVPWPVPLDTAIWRRQAEQSCGDIAADTRAAGALCAGWPSSASGAAPHRTSRPRARPFRRSPAAGTRRIHRASSRDALWVGSAATRRSGDHQRVQFFMRLRHSQNSRRSCHRTRHRVRARAYLDARRLLGRHVCIRRRHGTLCGQHWRELGVQASSSAILFFIHASFGAYGSSRYSAFESISREHRGYMGAVDACCAFLTRLRSFSTSISFFKFRNMRAPFSR